MAKDKHSEDRAEAAQQRRLEAEQRGEEPRPARTDDEGRTER